LYFVPAHCLGLSALEFFESLDSETDPSLSDLFRVFDRFGKLCGDQRPIFGAKSGSSQEATSWDAPVSLV